MGNNFLKSWWKIISTSFIFLFCFDLNGQTEGDIYVYGWCNSTFEFLPCIIPSDNSVIHFIGDSIISNNFVQSNGEFGRNAYSASFKNNNLEYFTNGVLLSNTSQILDSNLLSLNTNIPDVYENYTTVGFQRPLFLNVKGDNYERIFLFNSKYNQSNNTPYYYDSLFVYSELSSLADSNENIILSKNNVLLYGVDSSISGALTACRHANGRDWWVMKPGIYTNEIYQGLLDNKGIQMKKMITDVPRARFYGDLNAHFNLRGDKYYMFSWSLGPISGFNQTIDRNLIYVYDFDRCTGELSNPTEYDITEFTYCWDYFISCLSPDGSKFYFRKSYEMSSECYNLGEGGIYQYDFLTRVVNKVVNNNEGCPFLSPNGKWLLMHNYFEDSSLNGQPTFDIFYNPNELGNACNYQTHQVMLPSLGGFMPPNLANFRLGPIDGSVCDSLGLNAPIDTGLEELLKEQVKVFPNPTNGIFNVALQNKAIRSLRLFDMLGKEVYTTTSNAKEAQINLHDLNVSSGIYLLEINNYATKQRTTFKVLYFEN